MRLMSSGSWCAVAVLIGVNWLTFIWAVNSGFVIEVSLGYYINPLLSMLLGVVFLRERLRPWQWLPVALAALLLFTVEGYLTQRRRIPAGAGAA